MKFQWFHQSFCFGCISFFVSQGFVIYQFGMKLELSNLILLVQKLS